MADFEIPDRMGQYRMIDIVLAQKEWEYAVRVGRSRNRTNTRHGRTDLKIAKDGTRIHEQGAIGEVAVAKFCGLKKEVVVDHKPHQGADIEANFGTVAVKCMNADRRYLGGYLKSIRLAKECSADFACLTWIVGERTVRIVGLLRRSTFNRLVKKASQYGVKVPVDGWLVPWQFFCGKQEEDNGSDNRTA